MIKVVKKMFKMYLFSYPSLDTTSLKFVLNLIPKEIKNYYDPFFGSDVLLKQIKDKGYIRGKAYLNCQSPQLYNVWTMIAKQDETFLKFVKEISVLLQQSKIQPEMNEDVILLSKYINKEDSNIHNLSQSLDEISEKIVYNAASNIDALKVAPDNVARDVGYNILDFLGKVQKNKSRLSEQQVKLLITTAIKKAIYGELKQLYNHAFAQRVGTFEFSALFYYLQMTSYPFKYRYNNQGNYTCPYGGKNYNQVDLKEQLNFIGSQEFATEFSDTNFSLSDYVQFLSYRVPKFSTDDFMFLMPPAATNATCYNQQTFNSTDEERLRGILGQCNTKYILLIHNTPTTKNLFLNTHLNVDDLSIAYQFEPVNISKRKVKYLLVRNY